MFIIWANMHININFLKDLNIFLKFASQFLKIIRTGDATGWTVTRTADHTPSHTWVKIETGIQSTNLNLG